MVIYQNHHPKELSLSQVHDTLRCNNLSIAPPTLLAIVKKLKSKLSFNKFILNKNNVYKLTG